MSDILVTGAGGFIGHHLVKLLKAEGHKVRGVDIKEPGYEATAADEFMVLDLRRWENCLKATAGAEQVYALAADMGGMGFISANHSLILHNNALINLHTLEAARENGVGRYFYSSSACIYPEYRQEETTSAPLKEEDAYPAQPQDAYGWEKLVTELLCEYYTHDYALPTRVARFHNIYGPLGTWDGGREKAPAAMCRKVALAEDGTSIEVWGDGEQTRSFCYIDDCVEGIHRIMQCDYDKPLNLGSEEMVSINELAGIVIGISGKKLDLVHVDGPQGVRGRNSDNGLCRETLGWAPGVTLEDGLSRTYQWVKAQAEAGHDGSI
ncbi:MAG: NAD-dependent epimerase/dehydratase family protein [Acidimicrobiia bacterium]|nr:NAD-dependent epimerase/dehydratase family protein [Acidimicrobiia bacterium]